MTVLVGGRRDRRCRPYGLTLDYVRGGPSITAAAAAVTAGRRRHGRHARGDVCGRRHHAVVGRINAAISDRARRRLDAGGRFVRMGRAHRLGVFSSGFAANQRLLLWLRLTKTKRGFLNETQTTARRTRRVLERGRAIFHARRTTNPWPTSTRAPQAALRDKRKLVARKPFPRNSVPALRGRLTANSVFLPPPRTDAYARRNAMAASRSAVSESKYSTGNSSLTALTLSRVSLFS